MLKTSSNLHRLFRGRAILISCAIFLSLTAFATTFFFTKLNQPTAPTSALSSTDPDDPSNFTEHPDLDIPACASQTECFAFTIDTNLGDATTSFVIPTFPASWKSYDWFIDWGDGNTSTSSGTIPSRDNTQQANLTHTYASHGEYRITITDMSGKVLSRQTTGNPTLKLDMSSYPAGVYLLIVNDSGKRQSVTRIVRK